MVLFPLYGDNFSDSEKFGYLFFDFVHRKRKLISWKLLALSRVQSRLQLWKATGNRDGCDHAAFQERKKRRGKMRTRPFSKRREHLSDLSESCEHLKKMKRCDLQWRDFRLQTSKGCGWLRKCGTRLQFGANFGAQCCLLLEPIFRSVSSKFSLWGSSEYWDFGRGV